MSVKQFKKSGYTLLKNAINPELRDVITQYALFDEMQNFHPEGGSYQNINVPNAHSKYLDPAMEAVLLHIQALIEKNTDLKLYPTYSFYRIYRNGDYLIPHTDRPSCEISATVCFNYSYDKNEYTWPIIMNGRDIEMEPGDVVIYRGTEIEHSRKEFTPPNYDWHVQGFFHYIDTDGPYLEWKFDKRSSIGELKNKKKYIELIKK